MGKIGSNTNIGVSAAADYAAPDPFVAIKSGRPAPGAAAEIP